MGISENLSIPPENIAKQRFSDVFRGIERFSVFRGNKKGIYSQMV